jgi:hypothetical protein
MSFSAVEFIGARTRLLANDRDLQVAPLEAPTLERTVVEVYRRVYTAPDQAAQVSTIINYHLLRDEQGAPILDQENKKQFRAERIEIDPRLISEFSAREIVSIAPKNKGTFAQAREGLIFRARRSMSRKLHAYSRKPIWTK